MLLRNVIANWLALGVTHLLALVLTPLLVRYLGEAAFGVWIVFMNLMSVAALADMGVSAALINLGAAAIAKGYHSRTRALAASSLAFYLGVGGVVAVILIIAILFLDRIFSIPPGLVPQAKAALGLVGLAIVLGLPARTWEGMLCAVERIDIVGMVEAGFGVVYFVGAVSAVAVAGWGLVGLGGVYGGLRLVSFVLIWWLSRRQLPFLRGLTPRWNAPIAREMLAYGRDTLPITLGERMRQQVPVLMMGSVVGAVGAAHYGVGKRLIVNQNMVIRQAVGVAAPRFAALMAQGKRAELHRVLVTGSMYAALAAGYVGLALVVLGRSFIHLWVGPGFDPSYLVVAILAPAVSIALAVYPCEILLIGIGRHRFVAWVSMVEAVVVGVGGWWAIGRWAIAGAAGTIAVVLVGMRPWLVPWYACRQVGLGLGEYWVRGPLRGLVAVGGAGGVCWWVLSWWSVESWGALAGGVGLVTALVGIAGWIMIGPGQRQVWLARVGRALARWRPSR